MSPELIAQQSGMKWGTDVPLLDCQGLPCIDVDLGQGGDIRLAIDAGNSTSVLDSKVAQLIWATSQNAFGSAGTTNVIAKETGENTTTKKSTERHQVALDQIFIGSLRLENVPVMIMDLSGFISHHQFPRADGTLSYSAFQNKVLQFDFIHHRLRIAESNQSIMDCAPALCDTFSLINFNAQGPPVVVAQGFAVNGRKMSSQIDTMFTGSMLIYSSAVKKTALSEAANVRREREFPFTDGGVKLTEAEIDSETFHDSHLCSRSVYFPLAGAHEPEGRFDATVGLDALRNSVLTLDFGKKTISVQVGP